MFLGMLKVRLRGMDARFEYTVDRDNESIDYKPLDIEFKIFPLTPHEERFVEEALLEDMVEGVH